MLVHVRLQFQELLKNNQARLYYQLYRLGLEEQEDYYQESMIAMWDAYRIYNPDKGPLSTYFNYRIRYHLIDVLREESKHKSNLELHDMIHKIDIGSKDKPARHILKKELWSEIKDHLTEKQWKWIKYYVITGLSVREIASKENVSERAVRGWGVQARKKLKQIKRLKLYKTE